MKKLFCSLLLILLCAQGAWAANPTLLKADYSEWMTYYYVHKDPKEVGDFLKWLQATGLIDKHPTALPGIAAFTSLVFTDNPGKIKPWITEAKFTGKAREMIESALWLSGNTPLIKDTFGDNPDFAKKPATPLAEKTLATPEDLDILWGAFSESGDVRYIKKIIDAMNVPETATEDQKLLSRVAQWSIKTNIRQHELVEREVMKESGAADSSTKAALGVMLMATHTERIANAFPHAEGDFSAVLLLVDQADITKELAHPSGNGLHFQQKKLAKVGDEVAICILFTGMQLKDALQADVTYDLTVLQPDGKVYDNADSKNLEGTKAKLPVRFRIFTPESGIVLGFEAKDQPGVYTVNATLKDNIAHRSIPLSARIELKK